MYLEVVAMFCGPREGEDGSCVSMSRIDVAIKLSLELGAPLLIAGDGHLGADTAVFAERARVRGVTMVLDLYSGRYLRPNTLSDAIEIAECVLTHPDLVEIRAVHVVTDAYHVTRASTFLVGELERLCAGQRSAPGVMMRGFEGAVVSPDVLANEARGVQQYLGNRESYGSTRPVIDPLHPHLRLRPRKPVQATAK